MPSRASSLAPLLVLALTLAACAPAAGPVGTAAGANKRSPARSGPAAARMAAGTPRTVPQLAVNAVTLVGKAKIISDQGGALISDMGGAVISNNAGSLIANNGGGLVGKAKYALTEAAGPPEAWLADAVITVHDAAGHQLVDGDGRPLQAQTDARGAYTLKATLPDENLLLKIALWNGGELSAIAAKGPAQQRTVVLDTAATLGATYVLERFVKGDQKTFDKLPASEAEALRSRLASAQALIQGAPSYKPEESVLLTERLRTQDAGVDETLEAIKVLLLGGLGDGRSALNVALNNPRALALDADGALLIGEVDLGRVRRVAPDGTISTPVDGQGGRIAANFTGLHSMVLQDDGSLFVVSKVQGQVLKVTLAGKVEPVLGTGKAGPGPAGPTPGKDVSITPYCVARAADGGVWVGQNSPPVLLRLDAAGLATPVALPAIPSLPGAKLKHLTTAPDGTLYALFGQDGPNRGVWRRGADGGWTEVLGRLDTDNGTVAVGARGEVFVAEENTGRVVRLVPGEAPAPLSDPGLPRLVSPGGVILAPDGTLYVSDIGTNLVWARNPRGEWRQVAGSSQVVQSDLSQLTFSTPTGFAFDERDRLVVAEGSGHALKRWDGKVLETIAGGTQGLGGDGGPARDARFNVLGAVAFRGKALVVADNNNHRIREIGEDGRVRTLVGDAATGASKAPLQAGEAVPAAQYGGKPNGGLAVGPDGSIYWSSTSYNQLYRLGPDNMVRAIAGKPYPAGQQPEDGEDGPALDVGLLAPMGLAFKPGEPDSLYFADVGNCRVRRVVGLGGGQPRIETVAGQGRLLSMLKLTQQAPGWEVAESDKPAREVALITPVGLAFDRRGNLYVAETGTVNFRQLAANVDDFEKLGLGKDVPPLHSRVRRIDAAGVITTVVGAGGKLFPDPKAPDALSLPASLGFDSQGRLAIVDARSNSIRIVPARALE